MCDLNVSGGFELPEEWVVGCPCPYYFVIPLWEESAAHLKVGSTWVWTCSSLVYGRLLPLGVMRHICCYPEEFEVRHLRRCVPEEYSLDENHRMGLHVPLTPSE